MPIPFHEVVRTIDIGPIPTTDEPVELRVEVLHEEGAAHPYTARVWRRATILLRPADDDEADELDEFSMFVEDEAFAGEHFAADSEEGVIDQIRDRIEAVYYMPRLG
mgnify:CR=1 FL=1